MKCEVCNEGPPNGPAIYRVNNPGDMPARWRCAKHLTSEQSAKVDAQVRDIVETVEGHSRRLKTKNTPGEKCEVCGAPEVDAMTPRTVYGCGSSDYDKRPGTFTQGANCHP